MVPSLAVPHLNEVCNIHNGPVSPCRGSSQCVIFQNCRALNTRHLGVTNGRRGRGHVTRSPPIRGGPAAHQCLRSQDPLPVIVTPAPVSSSRLLTLTRCSHQHQASPSQRDILIQLGQLRLNPPGLGSKCGKWVERLSDFGKYKEYFKTHTHLQHFELSLA